MENKIQHFAWYNNGECAILFRESIEKQVLLRRLNQSNICYGSEMLR